MSESDDVKLGMLEDDLLSALAGIEGVKTLSPTTGVKSLILWEGLQKPAVGVLYGGDRRTGPANITRKQHKATTTWRVAIAVENVQGAAKERKRLFQIYGQVRERVNGRESPLTWKTLYLAQEAEVIEVPERSTLALEATFTIDVLFGQQ